MDYVDTQNLWQVANRNNLEMAEQFIQKMNKAYGVSEATLMNYQAIFKNMLSALGDLSDEVSSGLSMQLTQMALDFSSLYNVTIPSAMQKFQAVLSGQVRPIRSVSGYDITENTIFDLYAGAGGEKTMRQLSQIEKRLLRIVAVFDQMGATGATGDMAKTIESASNQARIMGEQAKETLLWTGQLVLMWLKEAQVLQHINAFLITMKEIMRAIAYDMGYTEENFLDGLVTSAESAGEAVDEIQGKLLSFDKFEALNSKDSNILGIDQTVLDLLQKVNYATEEFKMDSQKISEEWLKALDLVDLNGDGILDISQKLKDLLNILKSVAITTGILVGFNLITKISTLSATIGTLATMTKFANGVILFGLVTTIIKAVEAFREGDIYSGMLATTIGVLLVGAWAVLNSEMIKTIALKIGKFFATLGTSATKAGQSLLFTNQALTATNVLMGAMAGVLGFLVVDGLLSSLGDDARKIVAPIMTAVGAIVAITTAIVAMNTALSWGVALPIMMAGIGTAVAGVKAMIPTNIDAYATGGFPEDGLFFANSGEMVGQFSNGRTAVANNDQIVTGITQGVYSAMMAYNAQTRGQGGSGDVYLDGTKVGRVVAKSSHGEMVRTGLVKANS
jgi:hypothetical protein